MVTVQNPSPDIRIFALNSAFSSLAGRKMLLSRVVTLFEPPYEFNNMLTVQPAPFANAPTVHSRCFAANFAHKSGAQLIASNISEFMQA